MNKDSEWVILWRQRYRLSFILKDGVCVAIYMYNKHFILSDRPRFWYWCVFVCIGFDFVLWNVNEFQLEYSFKVLDPGCKKVNLSDSWVALSHAIFYLQCMFTKIMKTDFSNTWTDWTLYTKCCYYFEYIGLKLKKSRLDRSKLEKEYLFTWVLNY